MHVTVMFATPPNCTEGLIGDVGKIIAMGGRPALHSLHMHAASCVSYAAAASSEKWGFLQAWGIICNILGKSRPMSLCISIYWFNPILLHAVLLMVPSLGFLWLCRCKGFLNKKLCMHGWEWPHGLGRLSLRAAGASKTTLV